MKPTSIYLLTIIVFIAFMTFITAQEYEGNLYSMEFGISSVDYINLNIKANGYVDVEKRITLSDETAGVVIPNDVEGLKILGKNDEVLVYTINEINDKKLVKFLGGKKNQIKIFYTTPHLISKNGSIWTIRYSTSATPHHTLIYLHFLPNTKVLPFSRELLFSPIENGLILYPDSEIFSFYINYETHHEETINNLDYFAIGIILLSGLFLIVYIISRITPRKNVAKREFEEQREHKVKDSIKNMLDENERKIVEILEDSNDEITQAYIYKSTGIPKSSLSEIMNRLERRNIIERRKDGRIKWIKLKEWVFK